MDFPKSRYIRKGWCAEDGDMLREGSLEVSHDAQGSVVGVGARDAGATVWVELSFSSW